MPMAELKIIPKVDVESTKAASALGIQDSTFIRFRDGYIEKRGGWAKFINLQFSGGVKDLHAWTDNEDETHLAVATTTAVSVITDGAVDNVTPNALDANVPVLGFQTTAGSADITITDTGKTLNVYDTVDIRSQVSVGGVVLYGAYQITQAITNVYHITADTPATASDTGGDVPSFSTTAGSAIVTVTLPDHNLVPGQYFPVRVPTSVGGLTLEGQYMIISTPSSSQLTFNSYVQASSNATASMNSGSAAVTYYFAGSPYPASLGYGYASAAPARGYGYGGYGGSGSGSSATIGTNIVTTDYWLANWGDVLLSCAVNGGLYWWSKDTGFHHSVMVPTAPVASRGMLVVQPQQQVMLWGTTYNGFTDPLQIRWSDAGDYSVWQPQAINQAGGYHIPTGSEIVRVIQAAQQVLVFTDIDVYAGQYTGGDSVWGFSRLAGGCGLVAPRAVGIQGGAVFWMGQKNFFVKSGDGVQVLPCSVWDAVFQNLNIAQKSKIVCAPNAQFNEVMWFYPSSSATENDRYVCFNILSGTWDIGDMNRSAWIDESVLGSPIGADSNGYIFQHEISRDADGAPITARLTTGYATLSEAQDLAFVDLVYPDFDWRFYDDSTPPATVNMTFKVKNLLSDAETIHGPYPVTQSTPYVPVRFRARYMSVELDSSDTGTFWRTGKLRARVTPDGRR